MATKDLTQKALTWLYDLPRIAHSNLRREPGFLYKHKRIRGPQHGKTHNYGQKSAFQRLRFAPLGSESCNAPFITRFKREYYYKDHDLKRQYPPLTLLQLQKLIDTDRIDTSNVIDIAAMVRTGIYTFQPRGKQFGVHLTDVGMQKFNAKVDVEVQWIKEPVIAAIERLGGSVIMAYYDPYSLTALRNPMEYFLKGEPIPKRLLPPDDILEAYTDPKNRGYLADPQAVEYERGILAQKYGYELVKRDPPIRKDPRQIFFGLEPGWVINLANKTILKPKDPEVLEYYNS